MIFIFKIFNLFQINLRHLHARLNTFEKLIDDFIISVWDLEKASTSSWNEFQNISFSDLSVHELNFTGTTPKHNRTNEMNVYQDLHHVLETWKCRDRKECRKRNHSDPQSREFQRVCVSALYIWLQSLAHLSSSSSTIIYYVLTTICSSFCKLATHIILRVWLQLSLRRWKSCCVTSLYAMCCVSSFVLLSLFVCLLRKCYLHTVWKGEQRGESCVFDEDKAKAQLVRGASE